MTITYQTKTGRAVIDIDFTRDFGIYYGRQLANGWGRRVVFRPWQWQWGRSEWPLHQGIILDIGPFRLSWAGPMKQDEVALTMLHAITKAKERSVEHPSKEQARLFERTHLTRPYDENDDDDY